VIPSANDLDRAELEGSHRDEPRPPRRLGFAVKIAGRPDLKDHDSRRWQNNPHLRVSLQYLDQIFDYLNKHRIRMYRISSDIAPYITHPDLPQFHQQIDESLDDLTALGERAQALDLRLSMHPAQYIVLNSPNERVAAASMRDFAYHAGFLDALGADLSAKIVTHTGGVYGDRAGAAERFVRRYESLPSVVQRRLVLENDETSWAVEHVLLIHERTGIPLVFDNLHHAVNNPSRIAVHEAFRLCVATWPVDQIPKVHFSTQRHANREISRRGPDAGTRSIVSVKAKPGQHDDWIDGDEFITFLAGAGDARFDVMLEAKQKQLALFRLRDDLQAAGWSDYIW
jgi:UV DNA damage endonuclease